MRTKLSFGAFAWYVFLLCCVLGIVSSGARAVERDDLAARVKDAVDGHVLPKLRDVVTATGELSRDVTRYCESGDRDAWDKSKASFAKSVMAWAGVQHLRFGPMASKARGQRISFFPDPRGIVWRQLRPVLAKQDPRLLDSGVLGEQSVALQGLTALELLMTQPISVGESASKADVYKCQFASSVARNVLATSEAMLDGWTRKGGWRERIFNPGPKYTVYGSREEAAAELIKAAMVGFQLIRDQQVAVLQAAIDGKGKLSRLPYFRSGLSSRFLLESINSSCDLVDHLRLGVFVPEDKAWIRKWMSNGCRILKEKAMKLKIPSGQEELSQSVRKVDVRQLKFYSNGMRQLLGRDIAPAAGLTIGFNDLDGD